MANSALTPKKNCWVHGLHKVFASPEDLRTCTVVDDYKDQINNYTVIYVVCDSQDAAIFGQLYQTDTKWIIANKTIFGAGNIHAGQNIDVTDNVISAKGYVYDESKNSFAEIGTTAAGQHSHTEGVGVQALKTGTHAEGQNTIANGEYSHVEGSGTQTTAKGSHAEGQNTTAGGEYSHAEGSGSIVSKKGGHAEGQNTSVAGEFGHAEGVSSQITGGKGGHVEGNACTVNANYAHAEGKESSATAEGAHAEGNVSSASGKYSHAEGRQTVSSSEATHAEGYKTNATNSYAHAEGNTTEASGKASHAEGIDTHATKDAAHAEGDKTTASGKYSHAEGYNSIASGDNSHAEGDSNNAVGKNSHAEGGSNTSEGLYSHAEGRGNTINSTAEAAHAEGKETSNSGRYSHTEGLKTITENDAEHAEGKYNYTESGTIHTIGIGTADNDRRNAVQIMSDGSIYINNIGNYTGNNPEDSSTLQEVLTDGLLHAGKNIEIGSHNTINAIGYTYNKSKDSFAEGNDVVAQGNGSHAEGNCDWCRVYIEDYGNNWIVVRLVDVNRSKDSYDSKNSRILGDEFRFFSEYGNTVSISYEPENTINDIYLEEVRDGEEFEYYLLHIEYDNDFTEGEDEFRWWEESTVTLTVKSIAKGKGSHVEGKSTYTKGNNSHAEGLITYVGDENAHAEGHMTRALGDNTHAEGLRTTAIGDNAHAEGYSEGLIETDIVIESYDNDLYISSIVYHAPTDSYDVDEELEVGRIIRVPASDSKYHYTDLLISSITYDDSKLKYKLGYRSVYGAASVDIVYGSTISVVGATAYGKYSHIEGRDNYATSETSHAEGKHTVAANSHAHAEGQRTFADGKASHAEGIGTWAGEYAHAEGEMTFADGKASHAEGQNTTAGGKYSHAEGGYTNVNNSSNYGHAEGFYTQTLNKAEHAEGSYNLSHMGTMLGAKGENTAHSIGIGDRVGAIENRKNAVEIMQNGDMYLIGVGTYTGTDTKAQDASVQTVQEVINSKQGALTQGDNIQIENGVISATDTTYGEGSNVYIDASNNISALGYTYDGTKDSLSEGSTSSATGDNSHAEGLHTTAQNTSEHAEGSNNVSHKASDAYGNIGNTQHSVGIGSSESDKKNAIEIMQNGDLYLYGVGGYQGVNTKTQDPTIKTLQDILNTPIIDDNNDSSVTTYSSEKILKLIGDAGFSVLVVDELPEVGKERIIYLVPSSFVSEHIYYDLSHDTTDDVTSIGSVLSVDKAPAIGDVLHYTDSSVTDSSTILVAASSATDVDNITISDVGVISGLVTIPIKDEHDYKVISVHDISDKMPPSTRSHGYVCKLYTYDDVTGQTIYDTSTYEISSIETYKYDSSTNIKDEYLWVDGKYEAIGTTKLAFDQYYTITEVNGLLSEKANKTHTHSKSEIIDFAHEHEISEVNGLQNVLDGKQDELEAGDNINIDGGVISAIDTTYGSGANISIDASNNINALGYTWNDEKKSIAEGTNGAIASGIASHAEGSSTFAGGNWSHTEGSFTRAENNYSHAEGSDAQALADCVHAEGNATRGRGYNSHVEGYNSETGGSYESNTKTVGPYTTSGAYAHAEGNVTIAQGVSSHAEGEKSFASGKASHAEGQATAIGEYSHAEGGSTAKGSRSHAEGTNSTASGSNSHAEGNKTIAKGAASHAEGYKTEATNSNYSSNTLTADENTDNGRICHAEGNACIAQGYNSHAEGKKTFASGGVSHTEGLETIATNEAEHAQGRFNVSHSGETIHSIGIGSNDNNRKNAIEVTNTGDVYVTGIGTYTGVNTKAQSSSIKTLQEVINDKQNTLTAGTNIQISGRTISATDTKYNAGTNVSIDASNNISALGYTFDSTKRSFAEGSGATATGDYSHAEGGSTAKATRSHVEGNGCTAETAATNSHAEGYKNTVNGVASHAEGRNNTTTNEAEHAEGKYNVSHSGQTIHSIGIGNSTTRQNAVEITQNGDMYLTGVGTYTGVNTKTQDASVHTVQEVINSKQDALSITVEETIAILDE